MADILVSEFRVGHNLAGDIALQAAIAANVALGAVNILAIHTYNRGTDLFAVLVMATTTLGAHPIATVSTKVFVGDVELQDAGVGPLATWLNLQQAAGALYLQALKLEESHDGQTVRALAVMSN